MEEGKIIDINVELEFKDFWKVLFWQVIKKFWFMYFLTLVISLPIVIIFFYGLLTNPEKIKFSPVIIIPILPIIVVLISQWSIYSAAKASANSVKGKARWEFFENGFNVFTGISKSENDWQALEKVEEKKEYFLMYLQRNIFILIPLRSFQGEAQIEDFKQLIKSKLGDKAKLKK